MKIPRDGFDLIAVGGGIAGASLAQCVAEAGARVLILEAAEQFTDRVRGECLMPWGLTEAHALGLTGVLAEANVIRWANSYLGPFQTERRDLPATTAGKNPIVSFYHPQMQTRLLQAAEAAGTHVQRGMRVVSATGGHPVRVLCESGGTHHEVRGRLAAIATGRTSGLARALGFEVSRDNHNLCIAGVLLEGLHIPDDTLHWFLNPDAGEIAGWVPEGNAWVRTYLSFWGDRKPRFSGFSGLARLLRDMEWTGTGREFFSRTRSAGPLATFDAADRWVEYPYKNGVALLGDSAASNDPTWGQGLSIALRSARTLRDALMARLDWDQAGNDYAREFRRWYTNIRRMTGWLRELYMETGAAADVRRGQVFSLKKRDPSRYPDLLFSGPDFPLDSESRARFFGEDLWGRVSVQAA